MNPKGWNARQRDCAASFPARLDLRKTFQAGLPSIHAQHSPWLRCLRPWPYARPQADWCATVAQKAASPCAQRGYCNQSVKAVSNRPLVQAATGFLRHSRFHNAIGRYGHTRRKLRSCGAAGATSRAQRPKAPSQSAGATFPAQHNAPSRRRIDQQSHTK